MNEYRRFLIEQLDIQRWAYAIMHTEQSHIFERDAYIRQMELWLPHGRWDLYQQRYLSNHSWYPTKSERITHLLEIGKTWAYIQKRVQVSPSTIRKVKKSETKSFQMPQDFIVDGLITMYQPIRPLVIASIYT